MAMFDDPKKELAKLEAQLLKEEEWFSSELELAKELIGEEPAPRQVKKPAPAPEPKAQPKKKSLKGLVILAILETLGIVGVVLYWMLMLL